MFLLQINPTVQYMQLEIIQNNKGKEEKNNSKSSCNILGGASVHKRASYHMNFYIIANGN